VIGSEARKGRRGNEPKNLHAKEGREEMALRKSRREWERKKVVQKSGWEGKSVVEEKSRAVRVPLAAMQKAGKKRQGGWEEKSTA